MTLAAHRARMQENVHASMTRLFGRDLDRMREILRQLPRAANKRALHDELLGLQVVKLAAETPRTAVGKRKANEMALPLDEVDRMLNEARDLMQHEPATYKTCGP